SEGCEGDRGSIQPWDHAEVEQPRAKPTAGSPDPPAAGTGRAAAEEPGAEVCPPAGRGALLRQGAIASREDSAVPTDRESPAEASEKGGTQPQPLAAGGSPGTGVSPAAPGKAGSAAGRQEKVCPGEIQADSSIKIEICPWEESGGPGRAPGKGGSEGRPGRPGEEPGAEKPPGKTPELPKAGGVGGRRAEVCPWETGEGRNTVRAEICPWDAEGAQPEREGEGGERSPGKGAEEPDPGLAAKQPALPKTAPEQAGAMDRRRGDVCPWEMEDEPRAKTEICPWEEPAATAGKERRSQDKREASK
ncbi:GP179 protein, partial [Lophotis ruficrista]|nr:GP179 protein [Lophotis ruficrista]